MVRIPLTQGKLALVDDDCAQLLSLHKWRFNAGYAVRWSSRTDGKRRLIHMHRVIAGTPEGMEVDHVNGDSLDNRRQNLRNCIHSQNLCNQTAHSDSRSGFKGVTLRDGMFDARITALGKEYYLGRFPSAESAHHAYVNASKDLHGDFAKA